MALSYPLALNVFGDVLRVSESRFVLNEPVQADGTADGEVITASNADARWEGSISTTVTLYSNGKRVEALMDVLRGPNRAFLMRDPTYIGPQRDPTGAILAHRKLALFAVDTARIRIGPAAGATAQQGFPPELRLVPGDMIGWKYGSNPVRYALHRVAPAAVSYGYQGAGRSEWIDVVPNVRGAPQPGDLVTLVKPVCKALPVPGSISGGMATPGGIFSGWSFDWRQTFR